MLHKSAASPVLILAIDILIGVLKLGLPLAYSISESWQLLARNFCNS